MKIVTCIITGIINIRDYILALWRGNCDCNICAYTEISNAYEGIHNSAVPVWTASQSKGDNPGVVLDQDSVADSFRKATDVDTFITLNQTRENI